MRIGYLIGQFPMPTHTFVWRDVLAIERLGVEVDLVSTRLPRSDPARHAWCGEAIARTRYLLDRPAALPLEALAAAACAPGGAARCALAWAGLESGTWSQRATIAALVAPAARLAALARRRRWCHLHVAFPAHAAFLALFASKLAALPYSLGHHGDPGTFGDGLNLRAKWRGAAFGTAITERLRQGLAEELGTDAPGTVVITPMGVDTRCFARRAPYRPWSGTGPARVFSCGRGVPDKGHAEAVRALALLVERGIDAHLRIAGEFTPGAWFTRELGRLVASCGVEERVTLLGAIAEDEVARELEACHAFVLATHHEGLGVAIMEAMAMEVPVVATDVGGVPVLVDSGSEGLLVPPRDPAALAAALTRVLSDGALARSMGLRGRAKVEAGFTPARGAGAFVDELRRRYAP